MRILGIDPGAAPTICLLYAEKGKPLAADFWEDRETADLLTINGKNRREASPVLLAGILEETKPDAVYLERVSAMPKDGVTSAFRFGRAVGILEAVIFLAGYRPNYVTPQSWRKFLAVQAGKDGSRATAAMIGGIELARQFKNVGNHNKAEAFLIACYGWRKNIGVTND